MMQPFDTALMRHTANRHILPTAHDRAAEALYRAGLAAILRRALARIVSAAPLRGLPVRPPVAAKG